MVLSNKRASLFHLLTIRWFTLINVVLLAVFGEYRQSLFVTLVVFIYCLLLSVFWSRITKLIKGRPAWLMVDVTISGTLIGFTGGGWTSPYILYALTSILIASFFSSIKGSLLFTGYLIFLYTVGLFFNRDVISSVKLFDLNLLLTTYFAALITTIFFGYPAHIIRKIEETREDTAKAEERLCETKELIAAVVTDANALSCREIEILSILSQGKTNRQIAEELFISENTVKTHLYRIYRKMGVSSREEAIFKFLSKSNPDDSGETN